MIANMKAIGIFDSGIGGLTVAKAVMDLLPEENLIYFGDTARVPYGNKSQKQIIQYAKEDAAFLMSHDIKALVIACNTADSAAYAILKKSYDIPVFGVIQPAVRKAVSLSGNGKIAVIATNATIRSGAYQRQIAEIDPKLEVYAKACPLLVPLVEDGRRSPDDPIVKAVLEEYLLPLKETGADTLILGCTHYPLLTEAISRILPEVTVISSSEACAAELKEQIEALGIAGRHHDTKHRWFVSDDKAGFERNASLYLNELKGTVRQVQVP